MTDEWGPRFKTGTPEAVLTALRALPTPTTDAAAAKGTAIRYLGGRKEQIRYATFREQGLPIGSGMVESAGKPVVEARMKGSGMHWAARHLNSLLALRSRLCSGQWDQSWPLILQHWRQERRERQRQHRSARQAQRVSERPVTETTPPSKGPRDKTIRDGWSTPAHLWYGHRDIFAA